MPIVKYGSCPYADSSETDGNGCVDSCRGHDYRCTGIQKCCAHNCGAKCMNPMKLEKIPDRYTQPIDNEMVT